MPLYEFCCDSCGDFEVWRSMADASNPAACPVCEAIARRIFSAPNISLNKGSLPRSGQEPRLVKRGDRELPKPKYSSSQGSRPWMISH